MTRLLTQNTSRVTGLMKRTPLTTLVVTAFVIISCARAPRPIPEGVFWVDNDKVSAPEPQKRDPKLAWDAIDRTFFDQAEQLLNLERNLRIISGRRKQATNINSFDEVPNSSWFTNRHGLIRMTPEQIARGPSVTPGPDTTGPWILFRPKVQGATPGFWIEDPHGHQYIIKFDPPGHPELATAAAAIASRFFHACGYNVPQETIIYWRPDILKIRDGVEFTDRQGRRRPFTRQDLQAILDRIHREPDGRIRSLASLSLGEVKGPFSYSGRRKDDINDWCRHEERRELRALYVMASLVNHYDTKDQNTLDVWADENGRRFLKHYLIDFGSTFGSDGDSPKPPKKGYANIFDLRDVFVSLITLGLKTWPWEYARPYQYPSIGYFESEIFRPDKFDPILPNPAFEDMTDRDAYWGAKVVMAFRDEDLSALVEAGQLSDPEAEVYLLNTLVERRDKIGRHWFSKVNPLDHFEVAYEQDALHVRFDDLAVLYNLQPATAVYGLEVRHREKAVIEWREIPSTAFVLSADDLDRMISVCQPDTTEINPDDYLFEVRLRTARDGRRWSRPTLLWFWLHPQDSRFQLVGIEHLD